MHVVMRRVGSTPKEERLLAMLLASSFIFAFHEELDAWCMVVQGSPFAVVNAGSRGRGP